MGFWESFKGIFSDKDYTPPNTSNTSNIKEVCSEEVILKKAEIQAFIDKCDNDARLHNSENSALEEKRNSICPHCGSHNVVNAIKRIQGEIKGSMSGEGVSFLGFGHSSMSGKIKGEIDTNEVNKCNDCQHEWKIDKTYVNGYKYGSDILKNKVYTVYSKMKDIYDIKYNTKFDPNDLEEKYNSKEEKIKDKLNDAHYIHYWNKDIWRGVKISVFDYFYDKYRERFSYLHDYYDVYNKDILIELFGMIEG